MHRYHYDVWGSAADGDAHAIAYLFVGSYIRMAITNGSTVTIEYIGRREDGQVFDTSRASVAREAGFLENGRAEEEYEPLTFEIGGGRIIEGLEDGLLGYEVGDTPTIVIPPEEAYGEHNQELVQAYDAEEFTAMLDGQMPAEGDRVETADGEVGRITSVDDEVVRIDFNHALAGEPLKFEVEVLDIE